MLPQLISFSPTADTRILILQIVIVVVWLNRFYITTINRLYEYLFIIFVHNALIT